MLIRAFVKSLRSRGFSATPRGIGAEQRQAVAELVEAHRPAHVLVELCVADRGLRVGAGARVGLTTLVNRETGFGRLQVAGSVIAQQSVTVGASA